jgi:hypothetical protein
MHVDDYDKGNGMFAFAPFVARPSEPLIFDCKQQVPATRADRNTLQIPCRLLQPLLCSGFVWLLVSLVWNCCAHVVTTAQPMLLLMTLWGGYHVVDHYTTDHGRNVSRQRDETGSCLHGCLDRGSTLLT